MASDLISRAAAIVEIEEYIEEYSELDENGYHNLKWCAMEEAKEVLSMLPAVDAAPVVHARWISSAIYKGYMCCSHCTEAYVAPAWLDEGMWKYCPACGAKMDGGEP